MRLTHFETPKATIEYLTDTTLWDLRQDHAAMMGSQAQFYTDEECDDVARMIADIEALKPLLTIDHAR